MLIKTHLVKTKTDSGMTYILYIVKMKINVWYNSITQPFYSKYYI